MCTSMIRVSDIVHSYRSYHWFNCGRCPSCRQQLASRRTSRIVHHRPKGKTCYFVTLTYQNCYIPYVKFDELVSAVAEIDDKSYSSVCLNVYRDNDVYFDNLSKKHIKKLDAPICKLEFDDFKSLSQLSSLSGIRTKLRYGKYLIDNNRISIAYNRDVQNFFKRLRENYYRKYKQVLDISYFYAPEYGPTAQRFHVHLLIWISSTYSSLQVRNMLLKAWPYAPRFQGKEFCQIALSPWSYVASYVNCDASVSEFLSQNFKLRPSHSLGFGFDEGFSNLSEIINKFQNGCFTYNATRNGSDGNVMSIDVPYPSYVIYRYFPKIKGFSRCSRSTLLHAYANFEKLYKYDRYPDDKRKHLKFLSSAYYQVDGSPTILRAEEFYYMSRRLHRTYDLYYKPLGYNYYDYVNIVVNYIISRQLWLYKQSQSHHSLQENLNEFFNSVDDPNTLPNVIKSTKHYTQIYYEKVKQRKLIQYV